MELAFHNVGKDCSQRGGDEHKQRGRHGDPGRDLQDEYHRRHVDHATPNTEKAGNKASHGADQARQSFIDLKSKTSSPTLLYKSVVADSVHCF
jgi:hypothetical protein